ncbi:MAG: NAD-binding protein [Planctomycetes bacterium]|nr:NAD-binding protein [Planctomycetota bacterium]MCB9935103.1 NAD-binding protein [Planctomycetota bacterium]
MFQVLLRMLRNRRRRKRRGALVRVLAVALGLNLLFGTMFWLAERSPDNELGWGDSIWWAMVTMTTVGYGDFFPKSVVGRFLVGYPAMVIGVGVMGYLAATVADRVLTRASRRRRGLLRVTESGHIVICGYPGEARTAHLVKEVRAALDQPDAAVTLVTDHINELPPALERANVEFVRGDPIRVDVLKRAGVERASGVFVLASDPTNPVCDKVTFAVCAVLDDLRREEKLKFRLVAEVLEGHARSMFKSAHVDSIVAPEGINDALLAQEFVHPGLHDIFQELITAEGAEFYIYPTSLEGVTVSKLQRAMLDGKADMQLIGLIEDGRHRLNPPADFLIRKGMRVVVMANNYGDFAAVERAVGGGNGA